MKSFKIALLVALLLPLGGNALAYSSSSTGKSSGKSSGSSSSFKSGFSSQRSAPAKSADAAPGGSKPSFGSFGSKQPAAAPERPRSGGFGSFGSARNAEAPAPAKSNSALSRELDSKNAEANALKTLDARRAAAAAPPPLPPLNPVQPPNQQQPYNQPSYNQQPAPVVVQQSNGWGGALAGFMLGRAMNSGASHGGYYPGNGAGNGSAGGSGGGAAGNAGNASLGAAAGAGSIDAAALPVAVPKASFGTTVLRTFAWLALLGALGWLIYFGVRRFKGGGARSGANYSFERE